MSSKDYQVVFRGRLLPGQDVAQVKQNLMRLFKVDEARIEQMFAGNRQVLKKGLDRETADKYRQLLKNAGAIVAVVSEETQRSARVAVAPPQAAPASAPSASDAGEAAVKKAVFAVDEPTAITGRAVFAVNEPEAAATTDHAAAEVADDGDDELLAPVGEQILPQQPFRSLDFDIEGLTMAETGVVMDNTPRPPAVDIDTADMAASDDYGALDDEPPPPPPDIATDGLAVVDDETPVDQSPPPPPPPIDISGLSASDDFDELDAAPPPAEPDIDIHHLHVEDDQP